jgi:hypothetical protein
MGTASVRGVLPVASAASEVCALFRQKTESRRRYRGAWSSAESRPGRHASPSACWRYGNVRGEFVGVAHGLDVSAIGCGHQQCGFHPLKSCSLRK